MALLLTVERRDDAAISPTFLLGVKPKQNATGGLLPPERPFLHHKTQL
jgi:hypothetical protein